MARRRMPTFTPIPKALACGLLEDGGRVLFLVRAEAIANNRQKMRAEASEQKKIERLELPCVLVPSGRSPFAEIKEAFAKMTGIDGEIGEIILEGRHNAGSRKRKVFVPALAFKVSAKSRSAKPSGEFCGFRWLSMDDAMQERLGRNAEWLRRMRQK